MRQISIWHRVVLAAVLSVSFSCAYAAEVTARIKGTVTDPTGAVMPNLAVTTTNKDTGVVTTTTTSTTGDYIFQKLPIGTYSVSVVAPGFIRFTATGIALNIDQEYVLPIRLAIGSSVETVEVHASGVQVNTTDMQLSNVVDSHQIAVLDANGARNGLRRRSDGISHDSILCEQSRGGVFSLLGGLSAMRKLVFG